MCCMLWLNLVGLLAFSSVKFNYQVLESFDYQLNYVAVEEVCYFKTKDVFLCCFFYESHVTKHYEPSTIRDRASENIKKCPTFFFYTAENGTTLSLCAQPGKCEAYVQCNSVVLSYSHPAESQSISCEEMSFLQLSSCGHFISDHSDAKLQRLASRWSHCKLTSNFSWV